ncbi:oxygenase MpaB family protein [Nocardia sp. NPDC055321]
MHTIISDGAAFYAALPILITVVMSEDTGKGVDDHDRVTNLANRHNVPFEDFVGRFLDTADLVAGIAFAQGAQRDLIARTIKEVHRHVEGTHEDGRRYHAWNKDVWAWTWAGILKPVLDAYEQLHGPQEPEFVHDAYIGGLQLGDLFGVRGLPDTYPEFLEYWEQTWIPMARGTGTGKFLLSLAFSIPRPAVAPWIPGPVWTAATWPIANLLRTSAFAVLEPRLLDMLEIEPTPAQRFSVAAHRMWWRVTPDVLTRHWFGVFMKLRLRYGNSSWDRHYSPEALDRYHREVEDARAQGLPQPARPSKRH